MQHHCSSGVTPSKFIKISLAHKKNTNCIPPKIPNTTTNLAFKPSICFLNDNTKNNEELTKAYNKKIHCKGLKGSMHSSRAGT